MERDICPAESPSLFGVLSTGLCPRAPNPGWHCFHERGGEASSGRRTYTEQCCHCGGYRHTQLELKQDPNHGPYAPLTWITESVTYSDYHQGGKLTDDGTLSAPIYGVDHGPR